MSRDIHVDPSKQSKRWVSYLDLLGFTELIKSKNWVYIFSFYTQAIESLGQSTDLGRSKRLGFPTLFSCTLLTTLLSHLSLLRLQRDASCIL